MKRNRSCFPGLARGGTIAGVPLGRLADHETAEESDDFARGGPHAAAIVSKWPGQATRDWLASIGVSIQMEENGRLLATNAGQLREALSAALASVGVEVVTEFSLETISRTTGRQLPDLES
jgi:predicted flavoprotein YhiN